MRTGENIFKRRDGRWEARYHKGRDASRKLIYGFCYGKTYSEAKFRMEEAKKQIPFSSLIGNRKAHCPFRHYCEEWLETNRPKLRISTYAKYQSILEKYVFPILGDFFPDELTPQMVNQFSQTLLYENRLSTKTAKDILLVLHSALIYTRKNFAGNLREIEIIYPKVERSSIRVLSIAEEKNLTEYLMTNTDPCKLGVLLSLWTGLRIGELCALRSRNVSLIDKTISIEATMQRVKVISANTKTSAKTSIVIGPPKSKASIRLIPLTKSTWELCRKMLAPQEDSFILSGTNHYVEPRMLQYRFQNYIQECGIEDVHFHTLRHTFATRCIEAGVDVKTLSEILGHASASITTNIYVHPSMEMKRKNLDKLDMLHFL